MGLKKCIIFVSKYIPIFATPSACPASCVNIMGHALKERYKYMMYMYPFISLKCNVGQNYIFMITHVVESLYSLNRKVAFSSQCVV